uniref:Immunoglobulin V-set domain-containing protein n=1 Tax=Electrophorus electricus TaxID=8005 RepID=A0AAY5F660_ELEEL
MFITVDLLHLLYITNIMIYFTAGIAAVTTVQIHCSHRLAGTNVKYFCTASCTEKDILIKSAKNKLSVSGRFALFDEGSGVFTVTISNLRKSDSGTYWCGVERQSVFLFILASEPTPPSIVTSFRLPDHKTPEETGKWYKSPELLSGCKLKWLTASLRWFNLLKAHSSVDLDDCFGLVWLLGLGWFLSIKSTKLGCSV